MVVKSELMRRIEELADGINQDVADVRKLTGEGLERVNRESEATPAERQETENAGKKAESEASAVMSEFNSGVAAINVTESVPAESQAFTTTVEISAPDIQVTQTESTPTKEQMLKQADEVLKTSGKVLEYSKKVLGEKEEPQIDPSIAPPASRSEVVYPSTEFDEAQKLEENKQSKITRVEMLRPTQNVDEPKTEVVEGLGGVVDKSKPERPRINISELQSVIGLVSPVGMGTPAEAYMTDEERASANALAAHLDVIREEPVREWWGPIQRLRDNADSKSFNKKLDELSNAAAGLEGTQKKYALEIEDSERKLKIAEESIKKLDQNNTLTPEDKITAKENFDNYKKQLEGNKKRLESLKKEAEKNHHSLKVQMKGFEEQQRVIANRVERKNLPKLGSLRDQEKTLKAENESLVKQIIHYQKRIETFKAKKESLKGRVKQKALNQYDASISDMAIAIDKLIDKRTKNESSFVKVLDKIDAIEVEAKGFVEKSERLLSKDHQDLGEKVPEKTSVPAPAPVENTQATTSNPPSFDSYETSDSEPETEISAPEIKKELPRVPKKVVGFDVENTSVPETSVFPEAPKPQPKIPENPPQPKPNIEVKPTTKAQEAKVEKPPIITRGIVPENLPTEMPTLKKKTKKLEGKEPTTFHLFQAKLKRLGFDKKFIRQYTSFQKRKIKFTKQAADRFRQMNQQVNEREEANKKPKVK